MFKTFKQFLYRGKEEPRQEYDDIMDNPNFRKWFGNSVVTEDGQPLVVYNGSSANNTAFRRRSESLSGFYFSVMEDVADFYANENGGGDVYPCYLRIENPIYLPHVSKGDEHNSGLIDQERYDQLRAEHGNFDGVIGYSTIDKEPVEFVVFDPKQIKHVGNDGTFSNTDQIYK